jgi:N-acetylmuramoyl-L-alanine amidase
MAHSNYFNGGDRQSSADFFVDDKTIVQVNDYTRNYTWAVGDGKGKYGITNANSVSIEICVNEDGNYKEAYSKTVELTKMLMAELDIPIERVVRHYDASRKNCPASMAINNWAYWQDFKNRISANEGELDVSQYNELKKENKALKVEILALKNIVGDVYKNIEDVPEHYKPTIKRLVDEGAIKGVSENNLNMPEIMARVLVVAERSKIV